MHVSMADTAKASHDKIPFFRVHPREDAEGSTRQLAEQAVRPVSVRAEEDEEKARSHAHAYSQRCSLFLIRLRNACSRCPEFCSCHWAK